ncbi:MAG: RsmB/NOP family class I SAM-dependent RNA methyltransferase [Alphaproteobacteria bacterium]|nr:RsmB/NOP family class I SAM-dependent RNA methyltransferase [Alphaproteobacteria bacterium]
MIARPKPQKPRQNAKLPQEPAGPKPKAATSPQISQAILAALTLQEQGTSLDLALNRALKDATSLDPSGRRQVVRDLYAINRHRMRLSWHLLQEKSRVSPHHLFLAWSAFESRVPPKGGRYSDSDRALQQQIAARKLYDPQIPLAARVECPPAFEPHLREALGEDFEREMQATLEPVSTDIRVNLLKGSIDDVRKRLRSERVFADKMPFSPWGLRTQDGEHMSSTASFRAGLFEFQDEGSQLAALLCDARPGMQVIDFCAGTGGKTLALAAMMDNKGHLVACDISTVRMTRAKQRLNRAGVENAERKLLPAEDDKWMKKQYGRFDRVLVDAPCSGTGSWRRNPDSRWSTQAANIDELTALQDAILARAAKLVKPGGRLIYATCSLLPRENDQRVEKFLKQNPEFSLVDAREIWGAATKRGWPFGNESVLRLSPARHRTDGFFAAVMARAGQPQNRHTSVKSSSDK